MIRSGYIAHKKAAFLYFNKNRKFDYDLSFLFNGDIHPQYGYKSYYFFNLGGGFSTFHMFIQKFENSPFNNRPAVDAVRKALSKGRDTFISLSPDDQLKVIEQILLVFSRSRNGCDFSLIGGGSSVGKPRLNAKLSNWKKAYSDVRIIDQSPSGLYEKASINLLTLL